MEFKSFGKIARISREIIITEKIDGTNGQIHIYKDIDGAGYECNGLTIRAASRSQYITPENDNHGFAKWVEEHQEELSRLGEGRHFGEWWGSGINRGYGLTKGEKRFSLFNTRKWKDDSIRPKCCEIVPVLFVGMFDFNEIEYQLSSLREYGSCASPNYMKPEGVVIYHTTANIMFKKTIEKDEEYKNSVK